nr:glycoside hydrolase family 25 protein [uncultured Butyrivibrio sp.]
MGNEFGSIGSGNHHRPGKDSRMTVKIIITAVIICICVCIGTALLLIKKSSSDDLDIAEVIYDFEQLEEEIPEEAEEQTDSSRGDNSSLQTSTEDGSDAETSQKENEIDTPKEEFQDNIETASDPQVIAIANAENKAEAGAEINVADIVSASNVGENSSITYGIDVSRFQGTIDWAKVAEAGVEFAMIRVGYRDSSNGEIKADSNAKYNMQEAEKNGIKIGAYFFSTAVNSDEAKQEADWVKNYISQYPITYPVGYNCEGFEKESSRQYNLSQDERTNIAIAFLDQIYTAGYTPIFYASRSELLGDAKWNTSQIEKSYKIWMAWYNQDISNIANGPDYAGQCSMWQYSSQGNVPGIASKVDVDVAYFGYNGTESAKDTSERQNAYADVEALMNFSSVDETVTAKNSTNLRDKPSQGADSHVIITLQNGQTAHRTGISDSGWSRVVYEGTTYYAVTSFLTTDLSAPKQMTEQPVVESSGFKTKFTDCNENITAKDIVNLRSKPSVTDADSTVVATLSAGETAVRTGINNEYGWSRVEYNGQTLYCVSSYLRIVE